MHIKRSIHVLWVLMMSACACHDPAGASLKPASEVTESVQQTDQEPIPQEALDPVNIEAAKAPEENTKNIDFKSYLTVLTEKFMQSAISHLAYQPAILDPDEAHVRYLMRAARYREAMELAGNAKPSPTMKFIAAKARILAGKCTAETPCAAPFESMTVPDESLGDVFAFWHIQGMIGDKAFEQAVSALEKSKTLKTSRPLVLKLARAFGEAGLFELAEPDLKLLARLNKLINGVISGANAFETASLLYAQMKIAEAEKNNARAQQKIDQLILRYPATQMSLWPELIENGERLKKYSPADRYARTERLISHFDYDNARKELKTLISEDIAPSLKDKAEWELARVSMTNSEEPQLSENIYRKWAKKTGPNREEAVFGISRALSRQLNYPEAIKALENYDRQYPRGKYHSRSLYLRGWYLFDLRENEKARPLLKEYAEATNDTSVWGFYAQTFIRDNKWPEAIEAFEKLKRNQNPIVRGKALYWQAYAEYQLGNADTARKRLNEIHQEFPLTWYDMLAYQRAEDWFGENAQDAFRQTFRKDKDPLNNQTFYVWGYGPKHCKTPDSALWRKIVLLARYDEIEAARSLYNKNEKQLLAGVPASERDAFRHYATHLVESYNQAWEENSGSSRALSKVWPERSNYRHLMAYPQPFAPLVESLASEYHIPRFFIYGIMLQESRFRTWQVSSADAIGALQMIPKTARYIAQKLGLEYHPETFFDPRTGFVYSAYYMHLHHQKWGGNLTFTAGSYNGGPHRIGPWALRDKGKTIDFIVDEFSFDESRHYARKVAEHTLRFAYLYARSEEEYLDVVNQLFPKVVPDIEPVDDWGI